MDLGGHAIEDQPVAKARPPESIILNLKKN
jgi:hypothetical protein